MLEDFKLIQPIAYKTLKNTLKKKHISHAYLIETNGYDLADRFTMAFAKLLLCPHNGQADCQSCLQCRMIDDGNFPELKIINPDGSWIKKEQLTELQDEFSKKSIIGNKKVYIINKAEKLNINSANTILKFLEEPPEGIVAILTTDNIYQLIDTIVSRCQIISLNGQADLDNKSTFEKIGQLITNNDNDYQNYLVDSNKDKLEAILKFVSFYETYHKKILLHMQDYWFNYFTDKEVIADALLIIIYLYKDILNWKINCDVLIFNDYMEQIEKIATSNSVENLINKIVIINENRNFLENNANLNLLMDKIIIDLEEGVK